MERTDDSELPASPSAHRVQFYDEDTFLVESVARFVGSALGAGDAAVVIATQRHVAELEKLFVARGLDVASARANGRYLSMDAAITLSKLMLDGLPDPERFTSVVGDAIRRAADGPRSRVHAFGEMVALLWADGKPEAALRLEALWNDLARQLPLTLLCAYPMSPFPGEADSASFLKICGEHSEVIPAESYTALGPQERLRAIAHLQQKANALDVEIAKSGSIVETQARLAAIVESSDDAIIGKDLDGIATSWNAGAERIFGFTAEEMIGRSISRIIPPEAQDEFATILATIRRGERVDHFETTRVRKDGRHIAVSLSVSPIRDATGRIIGASKIARDVTERKRLEADREQLLAIAQRACAEAQEAGRSKDEFLAMLGHELRNPLAAVRNAVVTARLDSRRSERALDIACRQTEQLDRLVDDLLDASRIARGRIRLNRRRVPLLEIVERAVETTRFLVEDRDQTLSLSPPAEPVFIDGDPLRLQQIVVNLVNNAAKYTERAGRIDLFVERHAAEAVLRVKDSGMGISPDLLPRIFDLFVQGQRRPDHAQGGLGIGLAVVRSIVALHGGRVEVHSEGLGKGAEFVVHLPVAPRVAPEEAPSRPFREKPRDHRSLRVLVVEDNSDAAESLMMLLEVFGHQVWVAQDGPTALQVARADPPEVMLADIGLPGMDGCELARRARLMPELREVVLVALTGYGRDEDRQRTLAAGFDHHLTKPVDPDTLRKLLARFTDRGAREASA